MKAEFQLAQRIVGPDAVVCAGVALVLVERGELRTSLELGEPLRLLEGDVLVLGACAEACLRAGRDGARTLEFRAQGEWLARALALAGLELESAPLRAATLRAGTHTALRAARCLREIAAPQAASDAPARLARAARALELLGFACTPGSSASDPVRRPRRSAARVALADALEALAREPGAGLGLARLALRLGLSERQTSRLVHERLGCSLGEHLAGLRVARAKRLLIESDLAVIDVAAEAGFGSLGHFNQVFRSHSGGTPSAFRSGARRRAEASSPATVQLGEVGGVAPGGSADEGRVARASLRSSCFTIPSSQAAKESLPS